MKASSAWLLGLFVLSSFFAPASAEGDVGGDRIVVIASFFTTCGLICPILSAIYADLQDRLGDRLGRGGGPVSISVDPDTELPPRP